MESSNSLELPPVPSSPPPIPPSESQIMHGDERGTRANKIAKTTAIINLSTIPILILYIVLVSETRSYESNPLLWAIPVIIIYLSCFIITIIGIVYSIIGITRHSQRKGGAIFGLVANGIMVPCFTLAMVFILSPLSNGSLSGKVTLNYVPISQLDIGIASSKGESHAVTNKLGEYIFDLLEPDSYEVNFTIDVYEGYLCTTSNDQFEIFNLEGPVEGESILMVSSGGRSLEIKSYDQQVSDIKIICTSNIPATKNKVSIYDILINN